MIKLLPSFLLLLTACVQHDKPDPPVVVTIQPFKGVDMSVVNNLKKRLAKFYPTIKTNTPIDLPHSAYNAERNRYRADTLIDFLTRQTTDGSVTIGLTNKDISTTKGKIKDWGVMGLSHCPGRACVASTFRLSVANKQDQLFKVAIHELGHTQGLDHCPVRSCYMRDAEGGNPTDDEKEFCQSCKAKLTDKGVRFDSN